MSCWYILSLTARSPKKVSLLPTGLLMVRCPHKWRKKFHLRQESFGKISGKYLRKKNDKKIGQENISYQMDTISVRKLKKNHIKKYLLQYIESKINSLCPGDATLWHRCWSTLAQVMACCFTAPSHYLNQCWLLISEVLWCSHEHYSDVTMSVMASQITGVLIVCSNVCSGADHRKHQSSAPLAFVRWIHWWPVDSPHKGPVIWKMFPFDDVIMRAIS